MMILCFNRKDILTSNKSYFGCRFCGILFIVRDEKSKETPLLDKRPAGQYNKNRLGNCTIANGSDMQLAIANPIRYRGYYFDQDTGLYYLNARYYSPQLRRFIQPANTSILNCSKVSGLNLYTFANNHPTTIINRYLGLYSYNSSPRDMTYSGFNGEGIMSDATQSAVSSLPVAHAFEDVFYDIMSRLGIHFDIEKFDTSWPSLFVISNEKVALADWGMQLPNFTIYLDQADNRSLCVSLGNLGAFIGYNFSEKEEAKRWGIIANISLLTLEHSGKYFDFTYYVLGVGFICGWDGKQNKMRLGIDPPGFFGFEIAINFGQIVKDVFGWEW